MLKAVETLRIGDRVNLSKDKFADPEGDDPRFESEWVTVEENPLRETANCTVVTFDFDKVGFPVGHEIEVRDDVEVKVQIAQEIIRNSTASRIAFYKGQTQVNVYDDTRLLIVIIDNKRFEIKVYDKLDTIYDDFRFLGIIDPHECRSLMMMAYQLYLEGEMARFVPDLPAA